MPQQDVLRLDVPVDHAVLVGVLQGLGQLGDDLEGFTQVAARVRFRAPAFDALVQALALDVLHGEEVHVAHLAHAHDRHDPRVLELRRRLGLAAEAFDALLGQRQVWRQDLERDRAL